MKPNHVVFKIPYENPNELKSVVRDRTKQGNDDGCAAVEPDKNRGAHDIMVSFLSTPSEGGRGKWLL